jgi:hypothetical protein
MPDAVEFPSDFLPDPALIDAYAEATPSDWLMRLAKLRLRIERGHTFLREQADSLNQLYEEIAQSDADAQHSARVTELVLEKRRAAAESLLPGIVALRQKLAVRGDRLDPDVRLTFEESVEIAAGWLALYDTLHCKLLKLAAERRGRTSEVLRARPVAGEIDFAELSREHMARYPKIRAALAK